MQRQTASDLMNIRLRGSRPAGPVVVTDAPWAAAKFRTMGLYAFAWDDDAPKAIGGLHCVLYHTRPADWQDRADKLAAAGAKLQVIVKGHRAEGDMRVTWK